MELKEKQAKLARYLSFLEQDQSNLNLLISISNCYLDLANLVQAQHYLDKAKQIQPHACFVQQGVLDLRAGQLSKAKESFSQALEEENTVENRYNLAHSLYLNREFGEALTLLSPILLTQESTIEAEILSARILHQLGHLEQAILLLAEKRLHDKGLNQAELLGLLALLHFDNGEQELAGDLAKAALDLDAQNYEARVVEVMLSLLGDEVAIDKIQSLLAERSDDPRLWFSLGSHHFRHLEFQLAEENFLKAIGLQPHFYDALVSLGWSQLFLDKLDEAQKTYQQAISVDKESSDGWGGLALAYALKVELDEAQAMIDQALALDPDCFLTSIAQIIYANHRAPKQASKKFNELFPQAAEQINAAMAIVLQEKEKQDSWH